MSGDVKQNSITRRATFDVARVLAGEIGPAEERRLHRLMEQSGVYRREFADTATIMAELEGLADEPEFQAILSRYPLQEYPLEKYPSAKKPRSRGVAHDVERKAGAARWAGTALAAGLIVAAVAVWMLWLPPAGQSTLSRYVTRIGEQKAVDLPDGSAITLNTGTQLLVEFAPGYRRVILEWGEVYFQVAADVHRPFSVDLGERSVTVLGTEFNIRKEPEQLTLSVLSGEVALHLREDQASRRSPLLNPGEGEPLYLTTSGQRRVGAGTVVEYFQHNHKLTAYRPADITRVQKWRSGLLSFVDTPLNEMVQELNRYTAKKILINDKAIMDIRIHATIRTDQIALALEDLASSLPIKMTTHFDQIVLEHRDIE